MPVDAAQAKAGTSPKNRDVFVSHSTKDAAVAEEICAHLEREGISVWIAPRDVRPGRKYGEEILDAIEGTRATILVLSEDANASIHVEHEVERAVSKRKSIFPVRVANVPPARALELFVASSQWIDLWGPQRAAEFDRLVHALKEHFGQPVGELPASTRRPPVRDETRSRPAVGRPVPWIAAIIVAIVVGAGVLWTTGFLGSAESIAVQIEGPAEAEVRVDGKLAGIARAGKARQFPASSGIHTLHVEAQGYWPYDSSVEAAAKSEPVTVRLAKKSSLVVTTDAPGAIVSIDGKRVDRFPLDLPDGQHMVEVTAAGYHSFRKTVRFAGGAQESVNVALNRTTAPYERSTQTRGNSPPQSDAPAQQPSGSDAFLRGLGESVGRGGFGTRPPMPPFPTQRR
jgi:TIR domain/PEGA domain